MDPFIPSSSNGLGTSVAARSGVTSPSPVSTLLSWPPAALSLAAGALGRFWKSLLERPSPAGLRGGVGPGGPCPAVPAGLCWHVV